MGILISTNPAKNYEVIGSVNVSSAKEIKEKIAAAQKAKPLWKELGVKKRVQTLRPLYNELLKRKKEIALLTTREIGTPINNVLADLAWDQTYFKWFLDNGEIYLSDEITYKDGKQTHKIVYEPTGVAVVIVPWNFPWANFLWGVIPNLIAGNTVVFKHSEECPLSGKLFEEMMNRLGLLKGVFSEIYGDGRVGDQLVQENIELIWFTGSSKIGKHLYEIAGKKFIKAVLEMGGSNPAIVFEDVNIEKVVNKIYTKRFQNCGQACDALKRLLVHKSLFHEVSQKLKKIAESVIVGDPEDEKTQMGPLVAKRQLDLLESQVDDAVQKGARVITGGKRPKNLKGAYYPPTILTNIKKGMKVWKEEVFGPVLIIVPFETEKEAITLANDTKYGLGAYIFSQDKKRTERVASKLNAGAIDINMADHWLACNPFGGYKESGMGREHGAIGFRELCQVKVVAIG
ncbi:aldehyde dehydrogenase family protein [Candidatus Roizmanbacteria bacterium]|nr:aldehyde dehydrogenase family protein [Candidatus Roizmanbacteria bacterium]